MNSSHLEGNRLLFKPDRVLMNFVRIFARLISIGQGEDVPFGNGTAPAAADDVQQSRLSLSDRAGHDKLGFVGGAHGDILVARSSNCRIWSASNFSHVLIASVSASRS